MAPAADAASGFATESIKEGVAAVVRGPDAESETPGDATGSGSPKGFGVGMEGEFVETNVAAVGTERVRIGAEGDDARAIVEFDVADFYLFGEAGVFAVFEDRSFPVFDAVGEDEAGVVEDFAKLVAGVDVFDGGGLVFTGEEVIAPRMGEAHPDVFESVGEGPADADRFFREAERGVVVDPVDLVREESLAERAGRVEVEGGEEHGKFFKLVN